MSNEEYLYDFDPSGTSPDNRITGEQHVLSPPDWMDYYFIIPKHAPFFREGLKVVHQNTGRELVEGEDYHLTHKFMDATVGTAKAVYGSITFLDKSMTGAATVRYQTLGGVWMIDEQKIVDILSNTKLNPRITTWEQVAGMPVAFPPVDHDWHLDDLIGMSEVVDSLENINQTLGGSDEPGGSHITRTDNPHQVTKTQVGLSAVPNYAVASQTEAEEGTRNDRFVTPLRVKQAIDASGASAAGAHVLATDNPHGVTKAQVGLGDVENFGVADNDESVQGSSTSLYMTPRGTREAIDQRVGNTLSAHTGNTDNPHNVTKTQVGLGNVENYGIASQSQAEAGTANNLYMTPLRTKQLVDASVGEGLSDHAGLTDNPHGVTKAQVGLGSVEDYSIASETEARAGSAENRYMTPRRVAQAIDELANTGVSAHVGDTDNPHGVTKAQVGLGSVGNHPMATTADAENASRNDRYMSPIRTFELVNVHAVQPIETHRNDTSNPHEVDKAQVGLGNVENYAPATTEDAEAGWRDDRYMTPLRTVEAISEYASQPLNNHLNDTSNPHSVTAGQVGAYTSNETDLLLDQKVSISDITNSLTSNSTEAPLSANQGRVLKGYVDAINAILQSDDTDLDELQEIVDYIKLNRADLENLSISSISGLSSALSNKVDVVSGKGLSTNDFTNALQNKLQDIQAGAQVNVGTSLGIGGSGNNRTLTSSTGSNVNVPVATVSNAGFMSTVQVSDLNSTKDGLADLISELTSAFNDAADDLTA